MKRAVLLLMVLGWLGSFPAAGVTNCVADLGAVVVEGSALSRYRAETVMGGTFTACPPEKLPCVVDTLTEDFIRERNPTDLNDLLRWVPGIETGGTSLLVRQPGRFSLRGMGGTEPAFDGVIPIGRGSGLFMDPYLMERVEVVKGPIASLAGGAGASQNNNGAGGSINLYLKGAELAGSKRRFSETTSIGKDTWRERGMVDVNEVLIDEKAAVRFVGSFDLYSPSYINSGAQNGADPRQTYSLAPSFVLKPSENVTFGLKTLFVDSDAPSYIGIPVWRGSPGGGYDWHESSCRDSDRSKYKGMMLAPYVDWQVTDEWLLKFGGAFAYAHMEQTTREPYTESGEGLEHYFATGHWLDETNPYQTTTFSESRYWSRSFNFYTRSVLEQQELPFGFSNTFLVQPDFYYRKEHSLPVSRYGVTLQDSVGWGWVTLLGSLRYDYFIEDSSDGEVTVNRVATPVHYDRARDFAFSPRAGVTIQPLDYLVFFGNLSQTKTPQMGIASIDGTRPDEPWRATQYEGGVRLRPLEKLWLTASYYTIEQKHMPQMDENGYYYYEGDNRSRGVELSLSGDVTDDWTVMLMYAYNKYTDKSVPKGEKGRSFERTPRHAVTFNTSYRLHGFDLVEDVVLGFSYRFRSKSYATMRGSYVDDNLFFDPSHVFDFSVSVPLEKVGFAEGWYLTFAVRNIFDEKYFDTSRHYYECFEGEPRMFEIGIRGEF